MPFLPRSSSSDNYKVQRGDDWHSVVILGARASIVFVFAVPILLIAGEYVNRFFLRSNTPIVDNVGAILWICAGAMVTLLTVAFKMGAKHDSDSELLVSSSAVEPTVPGVLPEDAG